MTFDHAAMVQHAIPLPGGERSDRACAIRVRGISFTKWACSPLTRNGRDAPIPTSPHHKSGLPDLRTILRNPGKPGLRGEVALPARPQPNMRMDQECR